MSNQIEKRDKSGRIGTLAETARANINLALLGFLIVAPTVAVAFGNNTAAGILGAVGAAALLLTRLDDITGFKLLGLEAQLERSIKDANATIQQLQELALAISEPTLGQMAMSGQRFHQVSFETFNESKEKIVSTLRNIGASEDRIMKAMEVWNEVALRKLSNLMSQRIHQLHSEMGVDGSNLQGEFEAIRLTERKAAKPEVISEFLHRHKLDDPALLEMADDYNHLCSTGEVRRPELFIAGLGL